MAALTYDKIATQTLGSAAASITFSSIAASWTDLRLVLVGKVSVGTSIPTLRFNSDSTSAYSYINAIGIGTTATSSTGINQTMAYLSTAGWDASVPKMCEVDIFSYTNSTNKTLCHKTSGNINGSGAIEIGNNLWRAAAAITSITIMLNANNYSAGTTATLYGIKNA